MQKETVTLGGKEFTLTEQAYRPGILFRNQLKDKFGALVMVIQEAPNLDFKDNATIAEIIRSVGINLLDSVDMMIDMLFKFSKELNTERQWIENNAVPSEILDAFIASLILTFPFFQNERLRVLTKSLTILGSQAQLTEKNLPSETTENGQTNLIENTPDQAKD